MRSLVCGSLVMCLHLAFLGAVRAEEKDEAKAVVDKALKAMGGEAKVAKLKAGTWKAKMTASDGGKDIAITTDGAWQGWDQYHINAEATFDGRTEAVTMIINGDKGWIKRREAVDDAKEELPLIKNGLYAMRAPQLLAEFKGKDFKVSHLGEMKVNDIETVGVSVAHKDWKDISVYFDKKGGLPVKCEIHLTDPRGKEITVEFLYSEYKEMDGIQHPTKVLIKFDGKEATMEFSEIKTKDKVDDSEFAKP
jgi:outer membrane lipoprotein-sorting protein